MLTERRRALRMLGERSLLGFWLGRLLERSADWIVLLTLLYLAWNASYTGGESANAGLVAWTLAAWLIPRLIVAGIFWEWLRKLQPLAWPLLAAARALLAVAAFAIIFVNGFPQTELILGAAGVFGLLSALAEASRSTSLRARVDLADLGHGAIAAGFVDRASVLVGALGASTLLIGADARVAFAVAAEALVIGGVLAYGAVRRFSTATLTESQPELPEPDEARTAARSGAIYIVSAFTAGAMSAALLIATSVIVQPHAFGPVDISAAAAPLLVVALGLGLLIGPLPVPRLLLRIPAPLLLFATVLVSSVIALVVVFTQEPIIVLPAYVLYGLTLVTQDSLRAIALRRLMPLGLYARIGRVSLLALTIGQVYGAVGVVSIGSNPDPFAILVVLAVSQVLLVLLGLALGGRPSLQVGGLSSLPIKSVVHRLSWETRPATTGAGISPAASPRAQRLAKWINRTVELQQLSVTLPISGRHYEIYRPDEASRERLFEQGKADPEKQMPYWAKVWPSGVALADVVVERREEVVAARVLELGAGLGVTACAVLEYGGEIVTADYSDLPLAHCRLNTLVNTNKAPSATCFNWRHPAEVAAAQAQPEFQTGFPLIIAGDVLYEGRDAVPLLNVIDKMLVATGSLWLAEPVRRTAQRFLDSAASLGWEIESRQVQAQWPDNTEGPVNLHFLTRSAVSDPIAADLGGMRI